METNKTKTTTTTTKGPGSYPGIPAEVPEPDQMVSGMDGTGQENRRKTSSHKRAVIPNPVREVIRKTELQGLCATQAQTDPPKVRKRTERNLKVPDTEIPYFKAETALRDLVCSLLERKDRRIADIFLRITGLKHRVEEPEDQVRAFRNNRNLNDRQVQE